MLGIFILHTIAIVRRRFDFECRKYKNEPNINCNVDGPLGTSDIFRARADETIIFNRYRANRWTLRAAVCNPDRSTVIIKKDRACDRRYADIAFIIDIARLCASTCGHRSLKSPTRRARAHGDARLMETARVPGASFAFTPIFQPRNATAAAKYTAYISPRRVSHREFHPDDVTSRAASAIAEERIPENPEVEFGRQPWRPLGDA